MKYAKNLDEWKAVMELSNSKLLVVDFTATWCGPCRMIAPHFEALVAKYPDVEFAKVDVDEASDVAAAEGIQAMPTFKFYKNGQKVDEVMGADINKLTSKIDTLK